MTSPCQSNKAAQVLAPSARPVPIPITEHLLRAAQSRGDEPGDAVRELHAAAISAEELKSLAAGTAQLITQT